MPINPTNVNLQNLFDHLTDDKVASRQFQHQLLTQSSDQAFIYHLLNQVVDLTYLRIKTVNLAVDANNLVHWVQDFNQMYAKCTHDLASNLKAQFEQLNDLNSNPIIMNGQLVPGLSHHYLFYTGIDVPKQTPIQLLKQIDNDFYPKTRHKLSNALHLPDAENYEWTKVGHALNEYLDYCRKLCRSKSDQQKLETYRDYWTGGLINQVVMAVERAVTAVTKTIIVQIFDQLLDKTNLFVILYAMYQNKLLSFYQYPGIYNELQQQFVKHPARLQIKGDHLIWIRPLKHLSWIKPYTIITPKSNKLVQTNQIIESGELNAR